jgi:two-component system chemotaxis response regulator CheB
MNGSSDDDPSISRPFVITIGTSSGGLAAVKEVVAELPADIPACVTAVIHVAPDASVEYLVKALNEAGDWECREAWNGAPLVAGRFYLAPADRHLLLDADWVLVTKGPRENRWRPSIDALSRSAAVHHGGRVIGVLLTGELDDGVGGLAAIARCGGSCVVQDPADAAFPAMPANAIRRVKVDRIVPLGAIGKVVARLVAAGAKEAGPPPLELVAESRVAAGGRLTIDDLDGLGDRSAATCPECGGTLWELGEESSLHFRCHTGHAFSPDSLDCDMTHRLEATLWSSLRLFEERKKLIQSVVGMGPASEAEVGRLEEIDMHMAMLRRILLGPPAVGGDRAVLRQMRD